MPGRLFGAPPCFGGLIPVKTSFSAYYNSRQGSSNFISMSANGPQTGGANLPVRGRGLENENSLCHSMTVLGEIGYHASAMVCRGRIKAQREAGKNPGFLLHPPINHRRPGYRQNPQRRPNINPPIPGPAKKNQRGQGRSNHFYGFTLNISISLNETKLPQTGGANLPICGRHPATTANWHDGNRQRAIRGGRCKDAPHVTSIMELMLWFQLQYV